MAKLIQHDNSKMSLAVYLSVENPNKHVRHTLSQIFIENPIMLVKKLDNNNIEVWSKIRESANENQQRKADRFLINEVDTVNGEILSEKEYVQPYSQEMINFGK